jgi:hypothetical protein
MMEELLETEKELKMQKEEIINEKVQLDVFKNMLKTKQTALEKMRYNYI